MHDSIKPRQMMNLKQKRFGLLSLAKRTRSFGKENRGVAAMEFAMIAPFMILLWLGSIELSQGVSADRKVTHAASVLADLVTQETTITGQQMTNIMNAAQAIMVPFNVNDLTIQIAGVKIESDGSTAVRWSTSRNGDAPAVGGTYDIPASLAIPDSFLVVTNLTYQYTPPTTHVITGPINLSDQFFLRPRRSETITYSP